MKILGTKLTSIKKDQLLKSLKKSRELIFTPNPEILLEAQKNKALGRALKKATTLIPDGNGILLVSTLLKFKSKWTRIAALPPLACLFLIWKKPFKTIFPEVITGTDFMEDLIIYASENKKSVFFLGAKEDVAAKVAETFKDKYPELTIAGYSNLDPSDAALHRVITSKAQILFVAYGAPKQEIWLAENFDKMKKLEVAIGVGGAFDFWSKTVKRAPIFIRKLGLEWLFRLTLNPFKRAPRIFRAVFAFPIKAIFKS